MGQLEKEFRKEALVFIDQPTLDQIKNLAEQVGQSTSKNSSGKPTYVANRKSGVQLTTSNYDEFIEFICNDGKQLKEIKISSGNFGSTYFKIFIEEGNRNMCILRYTIVSEDRNLFSRITSDMDENIINMISVFTQIQKIDSFFIGVLTYLISTFIFICFALMYQDPNYVIMGSIAPFLLSIVVALTARTVRRWAFSPIEFELSNRKYTRKSARSIVLQLSIAVIVGIALLFFGLFLTDRFSD